MYTVGVQLLVETLGENTVAMFRGVWCLLLCASFSIVLAAEAIQEAINFEAVVFLELRRWDGSLRKLEPDFDYGHVALQSGKRYLHAHPLRGVEWVEKDALEKVGKIALSVLFHPPRSVSADKISSWVGLSYDSDYSWESDRFYCSELVAKALGISPIKMHFDLSLWPASFQKLEGQQGISPGGVYLSLGTTQRLKSE